MKRCALYHSDSDYIWTFLIPKTQNVCGCGSNCFHYEYDGDRVVGVCNACNDDLYEILPEFMEEKLSMGIWK